LLLPAREHTENAADPLQLGGRLVSQHPRERASGGEGSSIPAKEAEPHRGAISQAAKHFVGYPECLFHATPGNHCVLEIEDLFAEAGDLMDQFLLRAVLVAHANRTDRTEVLALEAE
jgi:hypothetical protein